MRRTSPTQTKMGSVICQYFHGGNWNEINLTKRNQAKRWETLHWRCFLPFGLRQRRSRWILNEVTISILVSNSRPRYQRTKSPSTIPQCLEERDLLKSKTHNKPTETFQFTHFASCHPPGVKHGFIKGEAMRLLRTNSPKEILEDGLLKFKQHLKARGYLQNIIERSLSRVNFASRQSALTHKQKVTTYQSAVKNLKQISMER